MSLELAGGDLTIHRIIEQETTFLPALEMLPGLTPGEAVAQSNKFGVWFTAAPSIASILSFVTTPPLAEKPPGLSPAASTRWQGTTIGHGLCPSAWPTSRDNSTPPSLFAMSP